MNCLFKDRGILAHMAKIVLQLSGRIKEFLALITLISSGILILTEGASPSHKSVSQEKIALLAVALSHRLLLYSVLSLNAEENLLTYFRMPFGACPPEIIESNIKPFINLFMDCMIVVTYLLWSFLLFQCFDLCCCSVFVGSANVQNVLSL